MIITSKKNQLVVRSRGLLREKKLRESEGLFGAEGVKLCREAIEAGIKPQWAIASETAVNKLGDCIKLLEESCQVTVVSDEVYLHLSEQKSPQGIFFAAQVLDKSVNLDRILKGSRLLMLDCIQDSGNAGTMLRTAEALGTQGVILGEGCADVWSPKTLRASMGSVFRLPLCHTALENAVKAAKESGFTVYAAMLDENALSLGSFAFPKKSAVIIGNEGHGVSERIAECCDEKLYIPISSAESLNAAAAAAVILWEMN